MHNIKDIRSNPELFDTMLQRRNMKPICNDIISLDVKYREALTKAESTKAEINSMSALIGKHKKDGTNADDLLLKVEALKANYITFIEKSNELKLEIDNLMYELPNLLLDEVADGKSEDDNILVKTFGSPAVFNYSPKDHAELALNKGYIDFKTAADISASRFAILRGALSKLERALGQFMLNSNIERGYEEISAPLLVNSEALTNTTQLPKFSEDLFKLNFHKDLWLIPTAEVTLSNLMQNKVFSESELPIRYTSLSHCFRSEAGAAGKDNKGIIRQHQFLKAELVVGATKEQAHQEHEYMLETAEQILQALEIPYRVVLLCSGDTGFSSQKTYDIEAWFPSQNKYREVSSCSICGTFQSRRMSAKYKNAESKKEFLYTLNGSSLAVGRVLASIIENYQREDGSIEIPLALRPFMGVNYI